MPAFNLPALNPPALNPDVTALMQATAGMPALGTLPPAEMRRAYSAARRALQTAPEPVPDVSNLVMPGPGGPLPLRVYRGAAEGVLPCLVFLHGGGWVLGDLDSHDAVCRRLANASGGCVIAVDYRLAPEHPFPAAADDALAALHWVAANAGSLGIDPARLAVGGDSAGGNLAAVLALHGRDADGPATVFQLLLYPATDLRMVSASYARPHDGLLLTSDAMRYFAAHYLPDPAASADWRASPLLAPSLAGTPAALVLTCGHDPLCDEGQAYATRLEESGVAVTRLHLSDQAHGILTMGPAIGAVPGVLDFAGACLKEAWRKRLG